MINALFNICKYILKIPDFANVNHIGKILDDKSLPFSKLVEYLFQATAMLWEDFQKAHQELTSVTMLKYENIEVTKEDQEKFDKIQKEAEEQEIQLNKTLADLRKENKEQLYHAPVRSSSYGFYSLTFVKHEIKTDKALDPLMYGNVKMVYGFEKDRKVLEDAYFLFRASNEHHPISDLFLKYQSLNQQLDYYHNDENKVSHLIVEIQEQKQKIYNVLNDPTIRDVLPGVIKVAKTLKKHYEASPDFMHVDDFMYPTGMLTTVYGKAGHLKEEVVTVDKTLIKMLTARYLSQKLETYKSAKHLEELAPAIFEIYDELKTYTDRNMNHTGNSAGLNSNTDYNQYLGKLSELQLKIFDLDETALKEQWDQDQYNAKLAKYAKEIVDIEDFGKVYVLDYELIKKFRILEAWMEDEGLREILDAIHNHLQFTGGHLDSAENPLLVQEVRSILSHKGMDDFDIEEVNNKSQVKYQIS